MRSTPHRRHTPGFRALAGWFVAASGPAALAHQQGRAGAVGVAAAVAVALAAVAARGASWRARLAIAAVLLAAVVPIAGVGAAVWAAAGLLLARWVLDEERPLPFLPAPGPGAVAPVGVLCAVAAWSAWDAAPAWRLLVPFGLACLAPVLTRVGHGAVARIAARVGDIAASAVSTVAFGVLGLLVILVPWSMQRLLRIDPLRPSGSWVSRRRRDPRPASPWSSRVDLERRPMLQTVRGALAGALTLALAGGVVVVAPGALSVLRRGASEANPFRLGNSTVVISGEIPEGVEIRDPVDPDVEAHWPTGDDPQAAMLESDWFMQGNEYNTAQGWAFEADVAWRPVSWYNMLDFRSRYLNIVDGERASWTPPPCDCRRLTVWMYGGSTTYGLNQRDDHTIASEIARVAHEHGITIDIHNRGGNGQLHWIEAERFAWDLTIDEPPDLVIFYDGVNDAWAGSTLNHHGIGDIRSMVNPTTADLWESTRRSDPPVPGGPPGSKLIGLPDNINLAVGPLEQVTMERYDRSREVSRRAAEAHGVVARYLWQPSRYSRPLVESEPHGDADEENRSRLSEALMIAGLPDDVIDVTDALRGTREPLFTDDVHHNELGSRLIAEKIFQHLEPDLTRLSGTKERSS